MAIAIFDVEIADFADRARAWAQRFHEVSLLESNGYADDFSKFNLLIAVQAKESFVANGKDSFDQLTSFKARHPHCWIPGFFSYDLKDELEEVLTPHTDQLHFPEAYFFVPQIVLNLQEKKLTIEADNPEVIFQDILSTSPAQEEVNPPTLPLQRRMSQQQYMSAFDAMQDHIRRGDIYEVNLCQEFFADNVDIDPFALYSRLRRISPTPFGSFFKLGDKYILSASPERFLAKRQDVLISQPIKGTAARGMTAAEDQRNKADLLNNPKEIAENIMIVDLVRNDLTRSAQAGTVRADRRLEVHSFQQVHQLISTITCLQHPSVSDAQAIAAAFPAGSMTGAPKIRAMQLCDRYELSKRGIYAGAIGYFAPDGDFDFNVVIRSFIYNKEQRYLSFHTGGAITLAAVAEQEYAECLLKASALLKALPGTLI